MISCRGLTLALGKKPVLREVDWQVRPDDFWLVIGPNGAGKTSLLRVLARFLNDFAGEVSLAGRDIRSYGRNSLARMLAYLPQFEEMTLPFVTVRDILAAGRYPYKSLFRDYSAQDREAIEREVERFSLGALLEREINHLSGGEKKKVFLASAMVQDVPLILLDEPMTFLDPGSMVRLFADLRELNRRGRTIVIVSHHVEIAYPHVRQVLALVQGRVAYCGARPADLQVFRSVYGVGYGRSTDAGRDVVYLDV